MLGESRWLHEHRHRMDDGLHAAAITWYRNLGRVPCVFRRLVVPVWRRTRRIPVIVQHRPGLNPVGVGALHALAARQGAAGRRDLPLIDSFALRVSIPGVEALLGQPDVLRATLDYPVRALLDVASPAVEAPAEWAQGVTGAGVTIAVVDTGIHPHPDLAGRIAAFADLVGGRSGPYDDDGHGTHVAGDCAGAGTASGGRYRGPAPDARLVGIKVLDKKGAGLASTIIAGVQWAIERKADLGIGVLNLSLGGTATQSASTDPLCQAVRAAWQAGVVVCAAAGNSGPQASTVGTPGIEPAILTVGAMDDRRTLTREDDTVAGFSSRGPTIDGLTKPDVLSPGVNVISLRAPGSYLDKVDASARVGTYYSEMSGTSMATPLCAGVAALVLSARPDLTPDEVKQILMASAEDRGLPADTQGAGYIDAAAAVLLAQRTGQAAAATVAPPGPM